MTIMKTNKIEQSKLKHLYNAFAAIASPQEAKLFLQDLCTPAELEAMADRWAILPMIKAGDAYRHIHEKSGVSVTTIGRVARCLTHGCGGYELIYQRITMK